LIDEYIKQNKIRKIVLILTQACNLSCVYCYEFNKSPKTMSFETAKEIIDSEFNKYGKEILYTIEFFGGEPLLNFELIRNIYDYVSCEYNDYNYRYCLTTNGTLFTNEIKEWFLKRRQEFEFALSLDGTEKLHNLNRPYHDGSGSYKDIDFSFFLDNFDEPRAKMTISKQTLPEYSSGVIHLHKLGFVPIVDMASLANYWTDADLNYFIIETEKLVRYYSDNPDKKIARMLDYDLRRVFIDKNAPFQYCGAGKNMVTYDVDGKWYPCMALSPVSQGKDALKFLNEDFEDFSFDANNKCKKCNLLRLCRSCYASNYNQTKDVQQQSKIQCKINRITIAACAKIQYNRLMKKRLDKHNLLKEHEMLIKSILRIQTVLNNDTFLC